MMNKYSQKGTTKNTHFFPNCHQSGTQLPFHKQSRFSLSRKGWESAVIVIVLPPLHYFHL